MNDLTTNKPTMSSLEISELVESDHGKVRQSIERLAKRGTIQLPPMGKVENKQSLSPNNRTSVYIFDAEHKRDSFIVVAQLSPEFTARIVDRWQELEARQTTALALPDFTDPVAAARAWADAKEAERTAQATTTKALEHLEAAKPAIEFHERVGDADSLHSIDETSKALQAPPRKFRDALTTQRDLFRKDGLPRQEYLDRGYVRVVETMIRLPQGDKPYPQTFFTGKGLQWIQRRIDHLLMGAEL